MPKPRIAITRDSNSPATPDTSFGFYADSVERGGGDPFPVYFSEDLSGIGAILDRADGILFSGGDDLDPALYGQPWHPMAKAVDPRRQRFELALLAEAEGHGKPILGICLGCQLLNVHRGGSLVQFLPDLARHNALEHRKVNGVLHRHDVSLEPDSLLGRTLGKPLVNVNTYHKQAIDRPGTGLQITARAIDGVIEAVEDPSRPLFLGVQWHPERISQEPDHLALFRLLVERAGAR